MTVTGAGFGSSGRMRRITAGISMSTAIVVVSLVGQLLTVPILLTSWGVPVYGEWVTLTSLATSLSILNLGIQSYAGNLMIHHYVRGHVRDGTVVLQAALRLYLVLCAGGAVVLAGMLAWGPLLQRLNITVTSAFDARVILGVYGVLGIYAIVGGLLMTLFRVVGQMSRQLGYGLLQRCIELGAPASVALVGGRPVYAALTSVAALGILSTVGLTEARARSPYPTGLAQASWRDARDLVAPSLMFFGVVMSTTLVSTGMTLIVSALQGPTAVAVFATGLMLTNMIRTVLNQGLGVLWPEITASVADPAACVGEWYRMTLKVALLVTLCPAIVLAGTGPYLLEMWTRGRIVVDFELNALLLAYLIVQVPALASGVFGLALNKQRDILALHGMTTAVTLAIAAALVPTLSLHGAAVALLLGQVAGTLATVRRAVRWIGRGAHDVSAWLLHGTPTAIVALVTGAVIFICRHEPLHAAAASGAGALVTLAIAWSTWLSSRERDLVVSSLSSSLPQAWRGEGRGAAVR